MDEHADQGQQDAGDHDAEGRDSEALVGAGHGGDRRDETEG